MRILQLTKKFPWPVKDGEVMGIINLTKGLADAGHEVTVLSLNTQKHHFNPEYLPVDIKKTARFIAVDIDTTVKPVSAFFNLFSSKSYNIERFYSKAFEKKIIEVLAQNTFDLIILEGIYLMRYIDIIRKYSQTKVALRPQNVEYIIWERLCLHERNSLKKWYIALLAKRMKKYEKENVNRADMLIPLSDVDEKVFVDNGCIIPHKAVPIGYVFDTVPENDVSEENAVAFIGGMDWLPNREGVDWFIQHVWPIVLKQIPDARFYLAGRHFPDSYKQLNIKGLYPIGEVDDARAFMLSSSISIAPLLAGSGMRVKIIEAMALGRAIVSTTIGAESIYYTNDRDIKIADTPQAFAQAVIDVLQNPALRKELGANAQQLVLTRYDNRVLCQSIIDFCKPHLS